MERQQLVETAREIMAEEFEVDKESITEDAPLMETLDLDSLDIVDMVVIVEEHFGFKLAKEDFASLRTFSDFYDLLMTKAEK